MELLKKNKSNTIAEENGEKPTLLYENENCSIEFELICDWGNGCNINIIIANIGDKEIKGWSFELITDDSISNLWNGVFENTNLGYKISAKEWNNYIAVGESVTVGITLNYNNSFKNPMINTESVIILLDTKENYDLESGFTYNKDNYEVIYQIVGSWDNASNVKITIINKSENIIHNWGLRFITSDIIDNIYNATEIGEENVHLIKNVEWNQDIPANSSLEFGFIQKYDSVIDIPKEFEIVVSEEVVESSDYKIEIIKQSEWNDYANIQMIITNLSEKSIDDWTLSFTGNFEIMDIWNAELISEIQNEYNIGNSNYLQNIYPGKSCFIGMNIKCKDKNINIKNCVLNEKKLNLNGENNCNEINEVYFSTTEIVIGQKTSGLVWAKLSGKKDAKIKVYKKVGADWNYVTDLYDSGDIKNHNDEIENDGIYTNVITFYEVEPSTMQYKVSYILDEVECASYVKEINFVQTMTENEYLNYFNKNENVLKTIKEDLRSCKYIYGNTTEEVAIHIREKYANDGLEKAECINGSSIYVRWDNGQEFYIQFSDKNNSDTMIRGCGNLQIEHATDKVEFATTNSRKILYWAPFDTVWGDSDETDEIFNIINKSTYSEDFDFVSDCNANVNSLKNINEYGLIIFATHGIAGEWIVTGEKVTEKAEHLKDIMNGSVSVYYDYDPVCNMYEPYYMINSKWILNNISNGFPNSIVINNSCESAKSENLWNAFRQLGVRTYYGNNGAVTNAYATQQCCYLVNRLICDNEMTSDAYTMTLDTYYGSGASFIARGQGNLALSKGMNDSSFENGMKQWGKIGDCRVLNKLGNIVPTDGKYMGMISTGIGYTMQGGAITQCIDIPYNANYLMFDWNFISAEFLEYIDSSFDDPFEISVECIDEQDEKKIIYKKSVNSIANDFGATRTSPGKLICISPEVTLNGYGDIWMSGWQSEKINIDEYSGKTLQITFSVANAKDTAYPSAVLLDNIHLDIEYGSSNKCIEIASDDYISENNNGKSYVFYTDEFEQQAIAMRKQVKYQNGYINLSQVNLCKIESEQDFVNMWNNMSPGYGNDKIDNVAILMHGNYYAIIIDSAVNENGTSYVTGKYPQNLTASIDGKVGSDYEATYIGSLSNKKIRKLNLYSCNAGLLDAINVNFKKNIAPITGQNGSFGINGNVAQAFMKLNSIDAITGYDGSVGYDNNNMPRISYDEEHYIGFLNELEPQRKVVPNRFNAGMNYFDIKYALKNGKNAFKYGIMPNGEVLYTDDSAIYNYYKLESKSTDGIIPVSYTIKVKHTAKINLINNTQENIG